MKLTIYTHSSGWMQVTMESGFVSTVLYEYFKFTPQDLYAIFESLKGNEITSVEYRVLTDEEMEHICHSQP
jgi:hypothetical protein